ncbi:MAG: hypothetical protein HOF72_05845 [Planctomycetaceae bacterium]|nr:hypothetical protein [Planctomycetaceae bacterium]
MSEQEAQVSLGVITVVDHDELGCIGGYLILNLGGRPLEFHCTAPVRANRAQQILYGVSLKPFLYGELVGRSLVEKGLETPIAILANQPELNSLQSFIDVPLIQVGDVERAQSAVMHDLQIFMETIPIDEPFGRITDAIEEARRGARAA